MKYSSRSIKTKWKLSWGEKEFKLLGIHFNVDLKKMIKNNFESKLKSIRNSISYWNRRKTPIGKITVVKSILISLLTNLFISLPSPSDEYMKSLNDMLYKFIWDGRAKIKKEHFYKEAYRRGSKNGIRKKL